MTHVQLDTYLSGHVFGFLLVFSRLGCVMMLFPGIGEAYVSMRTRLMLALAISFLLTEPLYPRLPLPPAHMPDLALMVTYEIAIGLFFGTLLRMVLSVLETTGGIIGIQIGLSNATILNPALAIQSTLPAALLAMTGVVLVFASGLDDMLIRSMVALYDVFPAGAPVPPGDMVQSVIQSASKSFTLGIELSLPFLIMGLLMFLALGLIQRLMPQVQLFLVSLPLQIWGGLSLMGLTAAGIMSLWLRSVDTTFAPLLNR